MERFIFLFGLFLCGILLSVNSHAVYNHHKNRIKRDSLPVNMHGMDTASFWFDEAQQALRQKIKVVPNEKKAKNVILFMGDAMSMPTITASRILSGQFKGEKGERSQLSFDKFSTVGLAKTYCVDAQVADSACTATAYLGGVKGNYVTVGVTANVSLNDCSAARDTVNHVYSIAGWAQKANKSTGLVTTTSVTHASPAGVYAHTPNRFFENDNRIKTLGFDPQECDDAAKQLVRTEIGRNLNVVLGGGTSSFLPNNTLDYYGIPGERLDGKNLIREWKNSKNGKAKTVFNRHQLLTLDFKKTDHLLGLFAANLMAYRSDADTLKEPTLTEMTEAAIEMLKKNENGFFLFVEGGLIDKGHHLGLAHKALVETVEFSKAIQKAIDLTNSDETLIVVTADHGHTMSMSGMSETGSNILGLSKLYNDVDDLPFTILSYASGPGYQKNFDSDNKRLNLSSVNVLNKDYQYVSAVPTDEGLHGGEDTAIYANGPWSHLFTGVIEQNMIPHIMAYASCIGEGLTMCQKTQEIQQNNSAKPIQISYLFFSVCFLFTIFRNQLQTF